LTNSDFPQQKVFKPESLNLIDQRELLHRFREISGMTFIQFQVFQHLKKNGMKSTAQISKELEIPKTNINAVLRSMYEKGLIKLKNYQPYRFYAVSIQEFLLKSIMSDYKKLVELEKILDLLSK
jgi:predicted transcriptional regulator